MTTSREWHLTRRPHGVPVDEDFALVDVELPSPGAGEILVRNTFLSVDPYMRGRMNDAKSYVPPFQLDRPMDGDAVGVVEQVGEGAVDSNGSVIAIGDTVTHSLGWRTRSLVHGKAARVLNTSLAPAQAYLGVLGMPGLTAYVGLLRIGELAEGDRVFVSAAAGAVGSLVGQLAHLKGASLVVGSAGGPDKTAWLLDEAGFNAAIDYKATPIRKGLAEAAPEGIDVYFDNVGGDHLEAAISALRPRGRAAICGMISVYNATEPAPGPRNMPMIIGKRLTLRGFIVFDHADLRPQFETEVGQWLSEGKIVWRETVVEGIDNAVNGFRDLLAGANIGKMLIRL
ncbi:MAG TPA: NADP-dependent oxidoreductase [Dermatophilaceae bacterium]